MSFLNSKIIQNNIFFCFVLIVIIKGCEFIVSDSKFIMFVVLSIILDSKNDENHEEFIISYHFLCKHPTQNNKFVILCHFCSDKITETHFLKQLLF